MTTRIETEATSQPPPPIIDLVKLKQCIETIADEIRNLKTSSSQEDKDKISIKVEEMLSHKKLYAENNNGIGIDGKLYQEPLSKAEKKKRDKAAKKAAAAADGGNGGGGGGGGEQTSANAAKKAAKKAEAKAKKAAMKKAAAAAGGGGGATATATASAATTTTTTTAAAAGASRAGAKVTSPPSSIKMKSGGTTTTTTTTSTIVGIPLTLEGGLLLQPNEIVLNPNLPIHNRGIIAITTAVLLDVDCDYTLISDHKRVNPAMGSSSSSSNGNGKADIVGDFAMSKEILDNCNNGIRTQKLKGHVMDDVNVDSWLYYANTMMQYSVDAVDENKLRALLITLKNHLYNNNVTYIIGNKLTLADVAIYSALGWPIVCSNQRSKLGQATLDFLDAADAAAAAAAAAPNNNDESLKCVRRWMNIMSCHPALRKATQLVMGITGNTEAVFDDDEGNQLQPLHSGMNLLQGATPGNVVTRFPPEPSGYLHIGHAKAVLLNNYYARRYNGRLIIRFDDTNPSKEKEEYQESIIQDLQTLGVNGDVVSYTSDYFDTIYKCALYLINNGLAFMDDTPQEQMQSERMNKQESKHRNQSLEETLAYFKLMNSGKSQGSKWCLRAKINMNSVNGTMRDPVIYRQNIETPHHRAGTTYKAYPTYDLACPVVDSIEGVTHALRTTEYNDRDEQYAWLQIALGLRRTRIHSFARMNFMYTELSKRKLAWFVENGYVTGWDDPRFPTIRGVIRRGINIEALRHFILNNGASRRVTLMDWSKFWSENKKEIDKYSKRFMSIDCINKVLLRITNGPKFEENVFVTTDYHPKDPKLGKRVIRICNEVYLETIDAQGIQIHENIVLMRWGVVNITKIINDTTDNNDNYIELEGTFIPNGDVKAAKKKLTWIAKVPTDDDSPYYTPTIIHEFDNLISKEKLEENEDFKDFINPNTKATTKVIGDVGLKTLQKHDIIQLERRGYYRVDEPFVSNEKKPLVLFMIPDGKSKSMSGLQGKLAHR